MNFFGLSGRPNLSSVKSVRILSSIRASKASNFALIASLDAIVYASKSMMLRSLFCCQVKGMYRLREVMVERVGGSVDVGYDLDLFCDCFGCSLRVWFSGVLGLRMKVLDLW